MSSLNSKIYSAKVSFERKNSLIKGKVNIRLSKRSGIEETFYLTDKENKEIDSSELSSYWFRPKKMQIEDSLCVFNRKVRGDEHFYITPKNEQIPTSLSQKLERLVKEVYENYNEKG